MNEKEKEQPRALCTHDGEIQTPSFTDLKLTYINKGGKPVWQEEEYALMRWEKCTTAKKIKLLEAVRSGAHFKARFDWLISDFPEPQPHFLSGVEQDNCHIACIPLVQVKYNGKFLICTRDTMKLFGLEWVRDW